MSLVACNGGGSTPSPVSSSTTVTQSVPVSNTAGSAYQLSIGSQLLTATGLSAGPTITAPFALSGTVAASSGQPSGVATFSVERVAQSVASSTVSGATGIAFFTFSPSANVTVSPGPFSIVFPFTNTPSAGVNYHLAVYNGSAWVADTNDVGVVSGNSVTISGTVPSTLTTLSANATYGIALYSVPSTSDSASGTLTIATSGTPAASTANLFGSTESVTLPNGSVASTITYSLSTNAPTATGALYLKSTTVNNAFGYGTFVPSATTTFGSASTVSGSFTLPTGVTAPSGNYRVAFWDSVNKQWLLANSTSTITGQTVSFSYQTPAGTALSLNANQTYYLALFN